MARILSVVTAAGIGLLASLNPALAFDCPAPAPAVTQLETYTPAKGAAVDKDKEAQNKAQRKPLNRFLNTLVAISDNYVATGDSGARDCGLSLLHTWATEKSLVGGGYSNKGNLVRAWALGTLSLSYIKLGALQQSDPTVNAWLQQLADSAVAYEAARRQQYSTYRDVDYWVALSVGATGLIVKRQDDWTFATRLYKAGIAEIKPDGTLPVELGRGSRATMYHAFAATPLVLIARLGLLRGENLFAERDGALCRLVDLAVTSAKDPQHLKKAAGAEQKPVGKLYWLPLASGCPAGQQAPKDSFKTQGSQRIGGATLNLIAALDAATRSKATQ